MQASPRTLANARRLRKQMSLPEVLLWAAIRRGQVDGLRFRRQHPLGGYVLDFYCDEARLAVEVDGAAHDNIARAARDEVRDAWLGAHRIRVLRLPAVYVLKNLDGAIVAIGVAALEQANLLAATRDEAAQRGLS
jgi:very-short-patch-repair endonuclease